MSLVAAAAWAKKVSPAAESGLRQQQPNDVKGRTAKPPPKAGAKPMAPRTDVQRLGRGFELYTKGEFASAAKELAPLANAKLLNRDVALYLLAESEALAGKPGDAL